MRAARARHPRALRRRAPAADQRAPPSATCRPGRRTRRRTAVGLPDRGAGRAGRVRQRRARPLARLRRHPPAVGAAPQRQRRPGRARRGRARRRRRRADSSRAIAVGLEVARPARHGRLRPEPPATRSSSSTASTPPRSAARWAARSPRRMLLGPGRRRACSTRSGVAASMASGIIEANRTGGTVKRLHCGWAAHAGGHRRPAGPARLHRPAHRAGGAVRLLRGLAARRVRRRPRSPTASATTWAVPGIFFKPYPANHFTHAAIDAGLRAARAGRRPERRRAHRPSACRPR